MAQLVVTSLAAPAIRSSLAFGMNIGALGAPRFAIEEPRRAGDPPSLVADSSRANSVLGWTPRHDDLDLIARTALAWERGPRY